MLLPGIPGAAAVVVEGGIARLEAQRGLVILERALVLPLCQEGVAAPGEGGARQGMRWLPLR